MNSRSNLYCRSLRENADTRLSDTGALVAYSGLKTGRSPKDKRVVLDDMSADIWWGRVNMPLSPLLFEKYRDHAVAYLADHSHPYCIDAYAGWDPKHRLKVRVRCTEGYHALFMTNMLIPAQREFTPEEVDFTIYNVGELGLRRANSEIGIGEDESDPTLDDTLVALNFKQMEMVIYGTRYAGEMKKGILTLFMYLMPLTDDLTLHSSANVDPVTNSSCLFFGLSGTGKTTISADPNRMLVGDDEHVWTDSGIFNIEGGCYAKCIGLKRETEPEIFDAIRFGAVLENVVLNPDTSVNYDDISITPNTRVSYPLQHIPNAILPSVANHPDHVILLVCDAFGVLPPLARLTPEQAVYFFVNGYTSKIPGTEMGVTEPVATFSACFGEPFLVHHPLRYGELLKEKLEKHGCQTWLVNTGWTGGSYGVGHRISLKYTRRMVEAVHRGEMDNAAYEKLDHFNIDIPLEVNGVPSEVLNPRNSWEDKIAYGKALHDLYKSFEENNRNL
jgi:phosphoenolpyruvate carboxykinase (ATP)